jgi:hypothetical protein
MVLEIEKMILGTVFENLVPNAVSVALTYGCSRARDAFRSVAGEVVPQSEEPGREFFRIAGTVF